MSWHAGSRRRRERLLLALDGHGALGAAVSELVDYEPPPGDRDPVRTVYLREATVRWDLYELEAAGLVERAPGWKRVCSRQMIAFRLKAPAEDRRRAGGGR